MQIIKKLWRRLDAHTLTTFNPPHVRNYTRAR